MRKITPEDFPRPGRELRAELISVIYLLSGSLRSLFVKPQAKTGLIQLEALSLGVIVTEAEPLTVSEIGRVLGYSRQSIQRAVNKLAEMGLVAAKPNPHHKRAPVFVATKEGLKRMKMAQEPSDELGEALSKKFDDERAHALLCELIDLLNAVDECIDPKDEG